VTPTLENFFARRCGHVGESSGFDTAAMEMQGVASLNNRCKDAVCHYELAWPPGERPTRPQWVDCALHTLKALGYEGHQFMIVAHDDKKHFHIHIMLNKVHPETLRAHTPYRDWFTLDAAVRFLEAKHGWTHTPGPMRWDEESKKAVLQSTIRAQCVSICPTTSDWSRCTI
jgi:hypothetical protein